MKFRSKIDFRRKLTMLFIIAIFTMNLVYAITEPSILNFAFLFLWVFLLKMTLDVFLKTYYLFDENLLYVKAGRSVVKIPYSMIESIVETNYENSKFALSNKVIAIKLNNKQLLMISPRKKEDFIREVLKKNNAIIYNKNTFK